MTSVDDLSGKVAIVTGAANPRGIGVATARHLGAIGARVVLADLATSPLEETSLLLKREGLEIVSWPTDISDEAQVEALMAFTRDAYGRLDVLDNNAACQANGGDLLIGDMDVALWDKVMSINARGTMLMCKHALPLMIESGGGSIINISSGTALAGDFYATAYACTKGAINTLTKYVATQYGAKGVRCNAIAPGLIMTAALEGGMPQPMQEIFRLHNVTQTLGTPLDIAEMVAFLASDRARFISGQVIQVDGGIYAHIPTTVQVAEMLAATTAR